MADILFGYCDTEILPSNSMGLEGYASRFTHGFENGGVNDPIYAKALCLETSSGAILLVAVDICDFDFWTADDIRNAVSMKTGIPRSHIMLAATHTHSAPVTISERVKDQDSKTKVECYVKEIKNKIISICMQACKRKYSAVFSTVTLKACLGYNRRLIYKEKDDVPQCKMLFNLWQNGMRNPMGTVDEEIPIIMIEKKCNGDEDDFLAPIGIDKIIIVNAPYHPVVLGETSNRISADYPGAVYKCIQHELGYGTKVINITGASGNTQPFISCVNNPEAVRIFGNSVGYGSMAALASRKYFSIDDIDAYEEEFDYGSPETNRINVQAFRLGKLAIVGISGDCFTELGIEIRKHSGFEQTLVATHTNGKSGYIPVEEAFDTGGYEVDIALQRGYARDVIDSILKVVLKLCENIKR